MDLELKAGFVKTVFQDRDCGLLEATDGTMAYFSFIRHTEIAHGLFEPEFTEKTWKETPEEGDEVVFAIKWIEEHKRYSAIHWTHVLPWIMFQRDINSRVYRCMESGIKGTYNVSTIPEEEFWSGTLEELLLDHPQPDLPEHSTRRNWVYTRTWQVREAHNPNGWTPCADPRIAFEAFSPKVPLMGALSHEEIEFRRNPVRLPMIPLPDTLAEENDADGDYGEELTRQEEEALEEALLTPAL